jgi:DUF917 family protein
MTKNKIHDLRDHLFLALEKLHDNEIDVHTAMAIAKIGQVVIESARVENQYQKIIDSSKRSTFIEGTATDIKNNLIG